MATVIPNPFDTQQPAATTTAPAQDAATTANAAAATQATPQPGNVPAITPSTDANIAPSISNVAQVSVTPDSTVEGRTAGIIAKNSPLMQMAETRALQGMNQRGLINSSMATGAAQGAVLDAATNIAKQDAQTYANANSANVDAVNKAAGANLTSATNTGLADIEAQYKNLTQASQSAASIINNNATLINQIMTNTSMSADAKQAAIDQYNANAKRSLQLIGSIGGNVDLTNFLDQVLA